MKVILDTVLIQKYPNLFVLCQDKINGQRISIINIIWLQ